MDLHGIRTKFCVLSGRYDLATTTVEAFDTDNGADYFINAGQRFLDRRYTHAKSEAKIYEEISSGAWYFDIQHCRSISEVWCNSSSARWQLTKYSAKTIKDSTPDLISSSDGGEPLYYYPATIRVMDATDIDAQGAFFNHIKSDDDGTYNSIVFSPKADNNYVIEVIGKFYEPELSSNDDENYWTNVSPDILIEAALYKLEVSYRNTEGAKDWLRAIDLTGSDLEKDLVEQESNEERVII